MLRATMDISAPAISLAVRPRVGHSGHQCSHAPGRPILHLVSSSRRPRRETGCGTTSLIAPHLVQFLCSCRGVVPSSRPALVPRRRAQEAVKAGRRAWLASGSGVSRPCLDGATMDISAPAISLAVRPRVGHSGHQCSHAPGRPILHLVSSSRRPRRETGCGTTSLIAPHLVQFLCSCRGVVPSSRPALVPRRRAQEAVKAGRRAWLASGSGVSRPCLDGREHGATLKPIGTPSCPS